MESRHPCSELLHRQQYRQEGPRISLPLLKSGLQRDAVSTIPDDRKLKIHTIRDRR